MTEEIKEPKQTEDTKETKDNTKEFATSFKIEIPGLDKLEEEERANIEEALKSRDELIKSLAEQVNQIKQSNEQILKQKEESEKQAILDKMKKAGYSLEPFKNLDLNSLKAAATALSEKEKEFVISRSGGKKEVPSIKEPMIYDPIQKKMVPFHRRDIPESGDKE